MSNTRYGRYYKPRYSQLEAFDLCHPEVREALNLAVIAFDTNSVLRYQKKHGVAEAVRWVALGNYAEAKRPWIMARGVKGTKGYVPAMPNPCVTLNLPPLL